MQYALYRSGGRWISVYTERYERICHRTAKIETEVTSGNVIANLGFIRHVGFLNDEGEYELDANYTALWGAMQSLGQMVGMLFLNPVSDLLGRKMTLYALWIILLGVGLTSICPCEHLPDAMISLCFSRRLYATGKIGQRPSWLQVSASVRSRLRCQSTLPNGRPPTFVVPWCWHTGYGMRLASFWLRWYSLYVRPSIHMTTRFQS